MAYRELLLAIIVKIPPVLFLLFLGGFNLGLLITVVVYGISARLARIRER